MNAPMSLTQLAAAWQAAKADEKAANARRLEIEQEIVETFPLGIEGTDTIEASVSYTLATNVENLTLKGEAEIDGTGNTLDNILKGNDADNTLSGGAGAAFAGR